MTKTALVTGSSKGIGKTIAIRLGKEGYITYVTYKSDSKGGENTVGEIKRNGGKAYLLKLDVCSKASVKQTFEEVRKNFGFLNILVSNAGIEIAKNIEKTTFAEWKAVTETAIHGNFLCTKYALPLMKNQDNANLIIITSVYGDEPDPSSPAYCVGKAGVNAFIKVMALCLPQYGIRTNAIIPGATNTPLWKQFAGDGKKMWEKFARDNPMGRNSTPEDIANAVMVIVNDQSRYLNGNFLYMDGGRHLKL